MLPEWTSSLDETDNMETIFSGRQSSWDTWHIFYSALNFYSLLPKTALPLGGVPAIIGKFYLHCNFECLIDEIALFYGGMGVGVGHKMKKLREIWFSISFCK